MMQSTVEKIINDIQVETTYEQQKTEIINGKRYFNDEWKVMMKYNGIQMTVPFTQGSGWNGEEPKIKDVLHSLVSDYFGYKDAGSMEEFGDMFGYETDEPEGRKKLKSVYQAVERHSKKLERFFTPEEIEELGVYFQDY